MDRELKKCILHNNLINALTLKERNNLIEVDKRAKVKDALKKYSQISSKCKMEKTLEKCKIENLNEEDFYMAFYQGQDNEINEILLSYIEKQEWFKFFEKSVVNFDELEEAEDEYYESKYNIQYAICFFILQVRKEIEEHIKYLNNIIVSNNVVNKMLDQLSNNSLQVFSKTVIYEFHLNKEKYSDEHNRKKLNQYIKDNFADTENLIKFYIKYPVLLRRLSIKVLNIMNYYKEMLTNLDNSYVNMCGKFINSNTLADISCDMGDTHEGGKFVVKVTFESNCIIYKPRNLYITKEYYEFINWLNKKSDLYKLPTVKTIWEDEYTIEACITYETAETKNQIERFYTRVGYYIGILYLFNGNDIHYENIIAHEEYPYIIDLETLFAHSSEQLICKNTSIEKIVRSISQSVKGTCLLPSYMFRTNEEKGVDIGGLSGKKAEIPGKRLVLSNFDSDNIRFEMQSAYLEDTSNIPMLNRVRVDYKKYINFILSGFNEFMNFIKNEKDEVKAQIYKFKNIRTRQVLRATNNYGYLLQFGSHPSYTQNMIYFERIIDYVWNHPYTNKEIISCEFEELIDDDIPVFYCTAEEKSVFSGKGKVINDLYEESSIDTVKRRIDSLSDEEIKLQTTFIKEALGILDKEVEEEKKKLIDITRFKKEFEEKNEGLTLDLIDKTYKNIFSILDSKAVYGENDINWIQMVDDGFLSKTISYNNANLYDGLSGILLYLYYKWVIDGDDKCGEMAKKVVSALNNIQGVEGKRNNIDAMFGLFSVIYPVHLYLNNSLDNEAIAMYDSIISWCEVTLNNIENKDIQISGLASLIIVFSNLYEETGDYKYYKLAKKLVDIVIDVGNRYILENSQSYEIDQLIYALQLANEAIDEDYIFDFYNKLQQIYRKKVYGLNYRDGKVVNKNAIAEVNVTPLAAIYKIKQFKIKQDEILLSEIEKCFKDVQAMSGIDIEDRLLTIDFLLEYTETFDSKKANTMIEKEISLLIEMYSMADSEKARSYNFVIYGLGLNSAVCGIGYRLLRYKNGSKVKALLDI